MNDEVRRRVEVFKLVYIGLKDSFVSNEIMQLPNDISTVASAVTSHSSLDWSLVRHNAMPIRLDPEVGEAFHSILLSDSAELGDGTVRVILFADGHVELSRHAH